MPHSKKDRPGPGVNIPCDNQAMTCGRVGSRQDPERRSQRSPLCHGAQHQGARSARPVKAAAATNLRGSLPHIFPWVQGNYSDLGGDARQHCLRCGVLRCGVVGFVSKCCRLSMLLPALVYTVGSFAGLLVGLARACRVVKKGHKSEFWWW